MARTFIKSLITANLKDTIKEILLGYYAFKPSFSQAGEDMVIRSIFGNKANGFFVDIGAFHPVIDSNTFYLYKLLNWRGINIEPRPGSKIIFDRKRKGDINLEIGIGSKEEFLNYYSFEEGHLNSFSLENLKSLGIQSSQGQKTKIPVLPLKKILEEHMKKDTSFDLLCIDTEGMEYEVLLSNDWEKYKPKLIILEELHKNITHSKSIEFLQSMQYELISKTTLGLKYPEILIYNLYFIQKDYIDGRKSIFD